ncbi:hypothetical protein B0H13DRAFT_2393944, partial [Mycena leptocephala]
LRLCQKYKDKAALLRQTGGGIGAPDDAESDGVHHYLDYYIPHDGPHHDTPVAAKNIWEQIHKDFPYFAALHQFLSTRPNIVPPVITTGTGPRGRQVVHNQPVEPLVAAQGFDESTIDPYLLNRSATPPPGSFSQTGGSEDLDVSPSRLISTNSRIRAQQTPQTGNGQGAAPKSVKGPKPSTFGTDLTNAMEKARSNLKHVPKKRSLEDVIMESSRENVRLARERADAQAEHRRQNLIISQKQQLMEMLKLGIYTIEETRQKIAELDAPPARRAPRTPRTPVARSSPHSRRFSSTAGSSPRWDIESSQQSLPNDSADL